MAGDRSNQCVARAARVAIPDAPCQPRGITRLLYPQRTLSLAQALSNPLSQISQTAIGQVA